MTRYGLSASLLRGLSLPATVEAISAAGINVIEVSTDEPKWWAEPDKRRDLLGRAGVSISSVHAGQASWDLAAPDSAERRQAVENLYRSCEQAAELGVDLVVCHCNGPSCVYTAENYRANMERSTQSLALAAERAGRAGIRLAVETMVARGERRPGNRVVEILEMIDALGDHVGVCVDTGHSNTSGNDVAAEILAAGDKLFATHLQDNFGRRDEDPHLLPGYGNIDWDAVLSAMDRLGYAGPRTIEVGPADSLSPEQTVRRAGEIGRNGKPEHSDPLRGPMDMTGIRTDRPTSPRRSRPKRRFASAIRRPIII